MRRGAGAGSARSMPQLSVPRRVADRAAGRVVGVAQGTVVEGMYEGASFVNDLARDREILLFHRHLGVDEDDDDWDDDEYDVDVEYVP